MFSTKLIIFCIIQIFILNSTTTIINGYDVTNNNNTDNVEIFNLTIIHNNDFHANYLPIKSYNNAECYEKNYDNDINCLGGVARTVAKVNEIRNQINNEDNGNVLFLNAGDHFQGTSWYTLYKSEVVADFVRLMKHDIMTLGNHEFDDGPNELENFIRLIENDTLPIVCCNVEFDNKLEYLKKMIKKSIVFEMKNNVKVAIIGYITPDTKFLSSPGKNVKFYDEIEHIQNEIQTLKSIHPELNIFIGLGHSGYDRDIEIAEKIPDLDIIVGGHSHTYLQKNLDENPPSIEKPAGPYPTIFEHSIKSSNYEKNVTTLIVQAFALGKYLGILNVHFNRNGEIINYNGDSILLKHESPEDEKTKKLIDEYNDKLAEKYDEKFGIALDEFQQQNCRSEECTIGNLIADSFVDRFNNLRKKQNIKSSSSIEQDDKCQLIALINGGNIRTSIDKGSITYRKLISVLPFSNSLGLLNVNGSELWKIFEHSAEQHDLGGFLQLSGARVTYNMQKRGKKFIQKAKLLQVETLCNDKWLKINSNYQYQIIINSFLAHGGDNYTINIDDWFDYQLVDRDILSEYIGEKNTVKPELKNRIKINIINDDDDKINSSKLFLFNRYFIIIISLFSLLLNYI